jgi:hypothetical protein
LAASAREARETTLGFLGALVASIADYIFGGITCPAYDSTFQDVAFDEFSD